MRGRALNGYRLVLPYLAVYVYHLNEYHTDPILQQQGDL